MSAPTRILVVDDDPKFRSYVSTGLRESGCECEVAPDGLAALATVEEGSSRPFDLILLDVMMPGQSGWEFLAELRARGRDVPVVFVTAQEAVEARVKGLQLGADDYIIKPFAFSELLARIQAVVRRRQSPTVLEAAGLTLDVGSRKVHRGDRQVELTPRECDLLRTLLGGRGRYLSKAELLRSVWDMDFDPGTNIVEVHVARLRRKLEAIGATPIRTKRGQGYAVDCASEVPDA